MLLAACGGNKNEKPSGENADSCAQALTAELDQALAGEQPDGKEVEELVKRGQDAVQELMAKGDSAAARAYADRLNAYVQANIEKIKAAGIREAQMYKLAGNSIVVAPMAGILKNLLLRDECETDKPVLL